MKYKKIPVICSLFALSLSGCTEQQKSSSIKLGLSVYDSYDVFLSELTSVISADVGANAANVQLESQNGAQSQHAQNSQVQEMIEDGCNVLLINLIDRTAPGKIIDMAREADVPVIFFNREPVEEDLRSWDQLYYVGADASESAEMQGNIVVDYLAEHPETDRNGDGIIQYYVLEGETGHQDSIIRSEGSVKTIENAGYKMEKIGYGIANWKRLQAQTLIEQQISGNANIELILSNNDAMACGAIDAYEEAGIVRSQRPVIIGIDGTSDGLQMVKEGKMIGTVYNDGINQAHSIYNLAISLATGTSKKSLSITHGRYILTPYAEVTSENVDYFISLK